MAGSAGSKESEDGGESPKERVDRELIELLNELRVALPGVQVLFAFLLVLPFQQGFVDAPLTNRIVYLGALLSSAVAGVLLIAPSVYHRLNFRRKVKEQMLYDSNRMLIAATVFVSLGITASLFVITDYLFGPGPALVVVVGSLSLHGILWYALPLLRRGSPVDEPDNPGDL